MNSTETTRRNYGINEIAQLFPPLLQIKNESLREKVAAVWNEAITTGCGGKGWTFDELRAAKFCTSSQRTVTRATRWSARLNQSSSITLISWTSISQSSSANAPQRSDAFELRFCPRIT